MHGILHIVFGVAEPRQRERALPRQHRRQAQAQPELERQRLE